jgi:hypothetical protein
MWLHRWCLRSQSSSYGVLSETPPTMAFSLMPFLWSAPLLPFRHLGSRILLFMRANVPLLYHQRVTIFGLWLMRDSRKYVVIE